ncbi:MAG: hypothetical protein WBA93_20345 [Microcoleaceae cyanobacterium]
MRCPDFASCNALLRLAFISATEVSSESGSISAVTSGKSTIIGEYHFHKFFVLCGQLLQPSQK